MAATVIQGRVRAWLALACLTAAGALQPPSLDALREFAAWFARPALLPFAWQAHTEARRRGSPEELFLRAQQVMLLVPTWTDGYLVFALDFVLAPAAADGDAAQRTETAWQRLQLATAWLEAARPRLGRRQTHVLQTLAALPEVAAANEPGLAERLRPLGGAATLTDRYLAELERLAPGPEVREQRTFQAPKLAAALLDAGRLSLAITVLRTAIERSRDVRDQDLASEWRTRLEEVVRHLTGDPVSGATGVDLAAVFADPRLQPLHPHLR